MSELGFIAGGTCGSNVSPHQDRRSRLTTSFGIVRDTVGIIIDNGHGVQNVVAYLKKSGINSIIMLQTHLHADHTDGLPQNSFLFSKDSPVLGVFAPTCEGATFNTVLEQRFAPHIWPVRPEMFGIPMPTLNRLDSQGYDGQLPHWLTTLPLKHPGGAMAYRISHKKGDIVIATDHEIGLDPEHDKKYTEFVSGAVALVADVQYRTSEHKGEVGIGGGPAMSRKGWGHSTDWLFAQAVSFCDNRPKNLFITHHDPQRPQDDLDSFLDEIDEALVKNGVDSLAEGLMDNAVYEF